MDNHDVHWRTAWDIYKWTIKPPSPVTSDDFLEVALAISGLGSVLISFATFFDLIDAIRKANLESSPHDE
jgi:hypothetical protein